ncbi:MAG: TipJ family phage tail tip protein [Syntrophorhabdaceae bacterium]
MPDKLPVAIQPSPFKAPKIMFAEQGLTIKEMINEMYKASDVPPVWRDYMGLMVEMNGIPVPADEWGIVPRASDHVLIHVPVHGGGGGGGGGGKDSTRMILSIVVVVIATAFTFWGGGWGGAAVGTALGLTTAQGSAIMGMAIMTAGMLLVNALCPIRNMSLDQSEDSGAGQAYSITGARNQMNPFGVVPVVLGTHKMFPCVATLPYIELAGNDEYLRMAFVWGYGRLSIGTIYIGDTPITSYQDCTVYTYEGLAGDASLQLIPQSAVNVAIGVECPYNTDVIRAAPKGVDYLSVEVSWPGGIGAYVEGASTTSCVVTIYARPVGGAWAGINAIARYDVYSTKAIRASFSWAVSREVDWELKLVKGTPDGDGSSIWNTVAWVNIQGLKNEDPITFPKPLAVTEVRIKASQQLNGVIDTLNAVVSSYTQIWNGSSWIDNGTTSNNPAALFRHVLMHNANARPRTAAQIDDAALGAWYTFCANRGYTFNQVRDFRSSVWETLADIAAAGRASPTLSDGLWSVVVDTGTESVVQHITPRNSWGFSAEKVLYNRPHAFRCTFNNELEGYAKDEIIVYDDGYSAANATEFESLEFPGITRPSLVWKFARFHMAQARLRPERYTVNMDFEHLVCRRGSKVRVSHDVPLWGSGWARVKSLTPWTYDVDFDVVNIRTVNGQAAFGTPLTTDLSTYLDEEIVVSDIALKTATGYLKAVGDKAVHMTSGVGAGLTGITVANNANNNFGTSNFTISWKGAWPDWTPDSERYIFNKRMAGIIGVDITVSTNGTIYLWIYRNNGGTAYSSTVVNGLTDGSEHEITIAVTRETASVAGSVVFYIDGVQLGSSRPITAGAPYDVTNTGVLNICGSSSGSCTPSQTKSFAIFNRALSAAEVLSLYQSGVATADQWGSQTAKYTSDFSADADGWTVFGGAVAGNIDSIGTVDDWLRFTCNTSAGGHYLSLTTPALTVGRRYRVNYTYYIPAGQSNINGLHFYNDNNASPISGLLSATNSVTTGSFEFTATVTTPLKIYGKDDGVSAFTDAGGDDVFYIKDVIITQIGATLALEPAGITASDWQDSSTNNLDASYPAAGATPVLMHDIASVSGGATYNWANVEAGFDPLQAAIYDAIVHDYINAAYTMGVVLDDLVIAEGGKTYCCRFRLSDAGNTSLLVSLSMSAGETNALTFATPIAIASGPQASDLAMYGESNEETVECLVQSIERAGDFTAKLVLVDEASEIYLADQGAIPAFDTHITRPTDVTKIKPEPPAIISVRSGTDCLLILDGAVKSRIFVALHAPMTNIRIEKYRVRYTDAAHTTTDIVDVAPESMTAILSDVIDGMTYQIQAQAVTFYGVASAWSDLVTHTVIGQTANPEDVEDLACNIVGTVAHLTWTAVTDPDLSHYRIRWSPLTSGATWANSVDVVERVGRPATSVTVPAMVGTYLIKAVDYAGNMSATAGAAITNIAAITGLNVVETVDQSTSGGTWDGTGAQAEESATLGGIILSGRGDLYDAAITDLYDAGLTDLYLLTGEIYETGTYTLNDTIDLGAVYTSRLTASITATGDDLLSDLYDQPSLYGMPNMYGAPDGSYSANLEVRITQDDTTGSPTWSAWMPFYVGDYTARGFQFRIALKGTLPANTPIVEAVYISIDMPDRILRFSAAVGTSGATVSFSPAFKITPEIGLSVSDGDEGDIMTISSKSASGFDIAFTNAGSGVARNISGIAAGYGEVAA